MNPRLAGPWRELFGQVQSPRHVLSELLQNADDAGANRVWVSISNNYFIFEHDGKDFDEEEFASLCNFAFSNKRKLYTIGFRGIGFKSVFSLGEPVEVLTPSLAVRFYKQRFTEPVWIEDAPSCDVTRITVEIQDHHREKELRTNLQDWIKSPASLLFFKCINELTIGDITLRKQPIGPGPVMGAERVRLIGHDQHDVIVFESQEEPFPAEAVDEIRQERDVEDLHLTSCRVQLVLGLPGQQRLYVVLPTRVTIGVPFSCNAPFLQDPGRATLKNPSLSPTNRWLLHRLGRLAGEAMLNWLGNLSLETESRAQAYQLLPKKPDEEDSLEADATSAICFGFTEAVGAEPLLLTTEGHLVDYDNCISPPRRTYSVWTPTQLLEVFGEGQEHVLSGAVTEEQRRRLKSWGWLDEFGVDDLISRLANGRRIPRPERNENLLALWGLVQRSVRYGYSYGGPQRRRLAIVAARDCDVLLPAERVVRLPSKKETIGAEAWSFLRSLVHVVDPNWLQFLESLKDQENETSQSALQLLKDLNLHRASETNAIATNACRNLFSREDVPLKHHIRIAHIMARLDARVPEEFRCITRDGQQRSLSDGIIATQDPSVEELLPENWAATHLLHAAYFTEYTVCSRQQWEEWIISKKSGFNPLAIINNKEKYCDRYKLTDILKSKGGVPPRDYPYRSDKFYTSDYDFDEILIQYWTKKASTDNRIWARVLEYILRYHRYIDKYCRAAVFQISKNGYEKELGVHVPADWIVRLRGLACLPDTHGRVRIPAELYLRKPETEPLMDVEPFVRAELDTEATKPLLSLLGVRDTPAGLGKLLERIRALARASDPARVLSEIIKWYGALDKALARCDADQVEEARKAFAREPLIITSKEEWAKTSEVFLSAGEDFPNAPVVHHAAKDLGMWMRLGVADRPTADRVLDWLNDLPSGQPLEQGSVGRVHAALRRYPTQVWQTCKHWLSLDNVWTPVKQFRYRLTKRSLTRWSYLFPAVKALTANLQMLSTEDCERPPFDSLPDLDMVIENRLTHRPSALADSTRPPWLAALSQALMRVKLADEADTKCARQAAARLARSTWQPFDDRDSIQVTPYVDGTPAGPPYSPDVLWYKETIFIKNDKLAKLYDSLADELAKPFNNPNIAKAIKPCIARPDDFIAEYMEEHFTLEAEISPEVSEDEAEACEGRVPSVEDKKTDIIGKSEVEEPSLEPSDSEEKGEFQININVDATRKPYHKQQPKLFERYARARGYRWDNDRQRFVHPDGSWIERCKTPPFRWQRFDATGNLVVRYWASPHRLTQGVEISAELWELLRSNPAECCLVLLGRDGQPKELPGTSIIQMVKDKVITLYPAKYRIRAQGEEVV